MSDNPAMTLAGLVTATGTALTGARALFGPTPTTAGFGDLPDPPAAPPPSWTGASRDDYTATTARQHQALDAIAGADRDVLQGVDDGASTAVRGRSGMTTVIGDTARGVAALAPATGSPAGQMALARHLQAQLNRAKALLIAFERRNITLALAMRRAAAGYPTAFTSTGMPGLSASRPGMGMRMPVMPHVTPHVQAVAAYRPAPPPRLPARPTQQQIADYIISKALSLGYTREQAGYFVVQAFGESHLSPTAYNKAGWSGIFQFDDSTWASVGGGDVMDAQQNIDNYFKLAAQRDLTPQNFTAGSQLGTQVSIGGPWHPENAAKGHLKAALAGAAPFIGSSTA